MEEKNNAYLEAYQYWKSSRVFDEQTRAEVRGLEDENEIYERFRCELSFGTGGLRGIMGAGTNRMNRYTVGKATLGLAMWLRASNPGRRLRVAISYDTRLHSAEFAEVAAQVLSARRIRVYLMDRPLPTPVLSYAVRTLHCDAGIMLTASHNPKEYNGYKAYDATGCQLNLEDSNALTDTIRSISDFSRIPFRGRPELIESVGSALEESFCRQVLKQSRLRDAAAKRALKIVYTPLHGTGLLPVTRVLAKDGFTHVSVVPKQAVQDGHFPTVKSPNPEEHAALDLSLQLAKAKGADLFFGTDPDSDRVGIGARKADGSYALLTGNQVGALLIDFVLSHTDLAALCAGRTPTVIKTIVTGELGADVAHAYGADVVDVLTGFKFIGDRMNRYERGLEARRYLMGYEESYGYLVGEHARDKDAVVASMLICEMAAFHKASGRTLFDALDALYKQHGFYLDTLSSLTREGARGMAEIEGIMNDLRSTGLSRLPEKAKLLDYNLGIGDLPRSNVLKFVFGDGSWAAVRPSGTEPKIKFYYSIKASSRELAEQRLERIRAAIQPQ
ncbi:MAG: phospho-sugar mutase [Clostridia bacterium]|nr:phospho-sugar mutase [Clostridia bacterium]